MANKNPDNVVARLQDRVVPTMVYGENIALID
jgi:hypothetical protein